MKTLTLLRHAEAGWEPDGRDFDRPLTVAGRQAARRLGRDLAEEHFDHVLASPALRVRETVAMLGEGRGAAVSVAWEPVLYLAEIDVLLDHVRDLPRDCERVLMVGHNPGLEELLALLLATDRRSFQPAALARIAADAAWCDWAPGTAALGAFRAPE